MIRSPRLVALLALAAGVGLAGVAAISSHRLPAEEPAVVQPAPGMSKWRQVAPRLPAEEPTVVQPKCLDCGHAKTYIPVTNDPEVNLANLQAAREIGLKQQRAREAAAHREHLKQMSFWHGTRASVPANVAEADRLLYEAVAAVFAADPPPPAERTRAFERYLNGQSKYKCVGWRVGVASVVETDSGREVTIHVRPSLMQEAAVYVFTPRYCVETWRISKDGTLQFVKSETAGLDIIFEN
jgi:hypothetical protein